ncbi:spore germination protein [Paenibacillus sp. NEAU-GSW1]|uniref:spore germination protein n=1 Tax=Paenibacillus sp. NEAU-GSW1 TaxID=2682486 RepID=UPI0012E30034|nr:spore germination protein [Paenibacillus sp. NEAU-GSW1]MUT64499.1 spore germination protein [Paenibacillus sp. NEAU-GSW1]
MMDKLTASLEHNIEQMMVDLGGGPDIVARRMLTKSGNRIALVYISSMIDADTINRIVQSIAAENNSSGGQETLEAAEAFQRLADRTLSIGEYRSLSKYQEAILALLEGCTVIMMDGTAEAIAAHTSGGDRRSVEESTTQTVIRGPKEGFTESIVTNTTLLRRRIKSPNLRIDYKLIGRETQTSVAVVYLKGITSDYIIEEMHRRLDLIDTDSILESGYIEEFIADKASTPFPLMQNSERPDAVAAGLLEGQIAVIVDGTPFVLLAPVTFVKFFQSSEDYYQRFDIATFLRFIRFCSFLVSMLMPSLYVAITTFHQEMLPTPLLISLAAQREGVPFPAILEALLMEITFEILREAGVRMPRIIGPAISIVGALVLGQAAVQAGLVSAAMVIVVSFTAIASFVIPSVNMGTAARLIRFIMIILAGSFGIFGIMAGLMVVLAHMAGLRSFGVPFLLPVSPFVPGNWRDVIVRVPWWAMKKRPDFVRFGGARRQTAADQQTKRAGDLQRKSGGDPR